uniref:Uncharacterized protein n=1 Tax=Fusarium oxysporum (strain Fo5176) TaxID=660025 RepID=A0A0D2YDV3_FUSOF
MMRLHSAHDCLSTSTLRSVRSIGNIKVLRDVIESIWKQQDLRSIRKAGQRVDWLQFVECDVPRYWYAKWHVQSRVVAESVELYVSVSSATASRSASQKALRTMIVEASRHYITGPMMC